MTEEKKEEDKKNENILEKTGENNGNTLNDEEQDSEYDEDELDSWIDEDDDEMTEDEEKYGDGISKVFFKIIEKETGRRFYYGWDYELEKKIRYEFQDVDLEPEKDPFLFETSKGSYLLYFSLIGRYVVDETRRKFIDEFIIKDKETGNCLYFDFFPDIYNAAITIVRADNEYLMKSEFCFGFEKNVYLACRINEMKD